MTFNEGKRMQGVFAVISAVGLFGLIATSVVSMSNNNKTDEQKKKYRKLLFASGGALVIGVICMGSLLKAEQNNEFTNR